MLCVGEKRACNKCVHDSMASLANCRCRIIVAPMTYGRLGCDDEVGGIRFHIPVSIGQEEEDGMRKGEKGSQACAGGKQYSFHVP